MAKDGRRFPECSVRGCQHCKIFEGAVVKTLLCPIKAYVPLELVHVDFTSIESTMELNQLPSVKNVLVVTDHSRDTPWHLLPKIRRQKL